MKKNINYIIGLIFLGLGIISLIFYVLLKNIYFIILVFLFIALFLSFFLFKPKKPNSLRKIIQLNKEKENLLLQKTNIQKQYLKREISEKQYITNVLDIDKKVLFLDYDIVYFDIPLEEKDEYKRKIKFAQKQYFKNKINEELYNIIQSDLSKKIANFDKKH